MERPCAWLMRFVRTWCLRGVYLMRYSRTSAYRPDVQGIDIGIGIGIGRDDNNGSVSTAYRAQIYHLESNKCGN